MTDYYQVFEKRGKNHGKGFKNLVQAQARHDFKYFLQSSPNAIEVNINKATGTQTKVATIESKESDTLTRRYFLCAIEDGIKIGDFLYWDNTIWLMIKKEIDTINAYDKFEGIECRHSIKWINQYGILQEAPCYLVAQSDEKVKPNFRTWNNMITPQPNKYLEIITSRRDIQLGQKFLIDETAWFVVESDYISVKNIIYLSLTEDKKDLYNDDLDNDIANIVDLNKFEIEIGKTEIELGVGDEYQINGEIFLNGNKYSDAILVEIIQGKNLISIDENLKLTCNKEGTVKLRVCMEENNEIYKDLTITVGAETQDNYYYSLQGDSSIKWGRTKVLSAVKVINGVEEPSAATFVITDMDDVLESYEVNGSSVTMTANSENKTGSVTIECTFEDGSMITKTVNVTSLWM